jgi:DNA-binding CsgD family transcriptional regulator
LKLHGRTTQPEDLDQCLILLRDKFLYREDQLNHLRAMWFTLLSRDIGRSAVVFDEAEPQRILAFGISAALSRERFDNVLRDKAPFIARTLLDEWLSDRKPFLDDRECASENASDGLSVFVLNNGISEVVNVLNLPNMLSRMSENLITQYSGCQLRAVAHEAFGVPPEFAIDLGMQFVDYAPEHHRGLADCPADLKPSIVIVTREQAQKHPGNIALNALFLRFNPPRFSLNAIERRLLRFAVEGESDVRIADFLKIAPRTLKKRWADIYLKMESVTGVQRGELSGRRGAEVRRHVLRYIRQHPQELHAYAHPASKLQAAEALNASGTGKYLAPR